MKNPFKKQKKTTHHQMTLGIRTQLCKECKDLQRRLCAVDGELCVFHRFADEDEALLHINVLMRDEDCRAVNRKFERDHVCPPGCSVEVVRKT